MMRKRKVSQVANDLEEHKISYKAIYAKKAKKGLKRGVKAIIILALVAEAIASIDQIVTHGVHLFMLTSDLVQGVQLSSR